MSNDQKNNENMDKTNENTMTFDKKTINKQTHATTDQEEALSRAERRRQSQNAHNAHQERLQHEEQEDSRQSRNGKIAKRKYRIRLVPIWLRLLLIAIFCVVSLSAGAMIGYGVIGNGKPMDVFHKQTWQHIINIVYEKK